MATGTQVPWTDPGGEPCCCEEENPSAGCPTTMPSVDGQFAYTLEQASLIFGLSVAGDASVEVPAYTLTRPAPGGAGIITAQVPSVTVGGGIADLGSCQWSARATSTQTTGSWQWTVGASVIASGNLQLTTDFTMLVYVRNFTTSIGIGYAWNIVTSFQSTYFTSRLGTDTAGSSGSASMSATIFGSAASGSKSLGQTNTSASGSATASASALFLSVVAPP